MQNKDWIESWYVEVYETGEIKRIAPKEVCLAYVAEHGYRTTVVSNIMRTIYVE